MHFTKLVGLLLIFLVVACAPRQMLVLTQPDPKTHELQRINLVTTRVLADQITGTTDRAKTPSRVSLDIAIPLSHQLGQVEYTPASAANDQSFAVASAQMLSSEAALVAAVRNDPNPKADVVVYVHGYNATMGEAVYRHAQIAHDFGLPGPQVTFSWASAARPVGYIYDRDSIGLARDDLESLLLALGRSGRKIMLVGHSMGGQLIAETLRQMSIGGRQAFMDRLSGVVLLSPDIDIDLFESQVKRIKPMPDPFVIFVSQNDRVLRMSARLTGQTERLGTATDMTRLRGLGISVIDLTAFEIQGDSNHLVAATSPTVISLLRGLMVAGGDRRKDGPTMVDLTTVMLARTVRPLVPAE